MHYGKRTFKAALLLSAHFIAVNAAFAADQAPQPVKAAKATKAVPQIPFFFINDNRLTYAFEPNGKSPSFRGPTERHTLAFTHFDAWAYGTNLVNIRATKSSQNNPASPCRTSYSGCSGAMEYVGFIRSTVGFNQVFNTKAFSVGPLRNVSLEVGGGAGVKNDYTALEARHMVAGLQFSFGLPYKGYLNISPMIHKAWYYTALVTPAFIQPYGTGVPSGQIDLKPTWAVEASYAMDLGFLPESLPLSISGRVAVIGPKGQVADPSAVPYAIVPPTKTEIISEPIRVTLDASKLLWGPQYSHFTDVWVAYKYRQNILGLDHALTPACRGDTCTESTVYSGITVKF